MNLLISSIPIAFEAAVLLAASSRLMVCLRSSVGRPGSRRQLQR
ncbi:hypothetical protein RINTU1_11960 [Candidatus Regiella insecticola]|uniref:Uncharacterized protein n=1 Tax=Candidatus Regiella insecticola TaxID=138073 RepID=A0A6L2ZML9_9ENTR|nr:hypothetical protein RINTU1_11960 [Candidatus Regiella insecticola]